MAPRHALKPSYLTVLSTLGLVATLAVTGACVAGSSPESTSNGTPENQVARPRDEETEYRARKQATELGLLAFASRVPTKVEERKSSPARVTAEEPEDSCESFYMPPEKFRVTKRIPKSDPCNGREDSVVADTDIGVIFLCQNHRTVRDYDFAMGRGGVGKQREGDRKTPLGVYSLARPTASRDGFKVVIRIDFPTDDQKSLGMTGSNIAIHGPPREFRCAGFLNTSVNWTDGCLAVSSDSEIKEIGRFIEQFDVKEIAILPLPAAP